MHRHTSSCTSVVAPQCKSGPVRVRQVASRQRRRRRRRQLYACALGALREHRIALCTSQRTHCKHGRRQQAKAGGRGRRPGLEAALHEQAGARCVTRGICAARMSTRQRAGLPLPSPPPPPPAACSSNLRSPHPHPCLPPGAQGVQGDHPAGLARHPGQLRQLQGAAGGARGGGPVHAGGRAGAGAGGGAGELPPSRCFMGRAVPALPLCPHAFRPACSANSTHHTTNHRPTRSWAAPGSRRAARRRRRPAPPTRRPPTLPPRWRRRWPRPRTPPASRCTTTLWASTRWCTWSARTARGRARRRWCATCATPRSAAAKTPRAGATASTPWSRWGGGVWQGYC